MKQKQIAIILIPVFILTVIWLVSNVYHSYVSSTIEVPVADQIIPIDGKFDTATLDQIKSRTQVNPLNEIQPEPSENPSETPTPTPIFKESAGSESAKVSPTPSTTR